MASSKAKAKSQPKAKAKAKSRKPEQTGDEVRMLAPKKTVAGYIDFIRACKSRTSEVGQSITTETKKAQEAGVNVPAARIAERIYAKAQRDAIKGRVLWEDVVFYLTECTDFDKIAPTSMFKADEVRSTKSSKRKKNGKAEQIDLSERTDAEPTSEPAEPMSAVEEASEERAYH